MKPTIFAVLTVSIASALPIEATAQRAGTTEGWSVAVGAGLILAPSYEGDDAYQLSAVPNVRLSYGDDFFASVEGGVGYNLINSEGWRAGPIAAYHFGRDDDGQGPFVIAGDETDDLNGLDDVDGTVEIGGFVEYTARPFTTRIELRQGLNGHEGFIGEAELRFGGRAVVADQMIVFSLGPEITVVDRTYNDAFFGVDEAASAASGLDAFDADGGLHSYGLGASVIVPFTDHVSAVSFARYGRLTGDAADSSLVEDRGSPNQGALGVFLTYTF